MVKKGRGVYYNLKEGREREGGGGDNMKRKKRKKKVAKKVGKTKICLIIVYRSLNFPI
jgi:hypothetical protein